MTKREQNIHGFDLVPLHRFSYFVNIQASRCTHKHLRTPSCFEATSARDPRKMKLHGTCRLFRYCSNDSNVNEKLIDFLRNIAKLRSLKSQDPQALQAKLPQFRTHQTRVLSPLLQPPVLADQWQRCGAMAYHCLQCSDSSLYSE